MALRKNQSPFFPHFYVIARNHSASSISPVAGSWGPSPPSFEASRHLFSFFFLLTFSSLQLLQILYTGPSSPSGWFVPTPPASKFPPYDIIRAMERITLCYFPLGFSDLPTIHKRSSAPLPPSLSALCPPPEVREVLSSVRGDLTLLSRPRLRNLRAPLPESPRLEHRSKRPIGLVLSLVD